MVRRATLVFSVLVTCFCPPARAAATADVPPVYDVVVYGGTSGGIAAAVQAKRMGKSVVLVSPDKHLGGLTTGGLGATDIGNKGAIGGIAREFYGRIWKHYQQPGAWEQETQEEYLKSRRSRQDPDETTMWTFEPHVATKVYDEMLKEAGVPVVIGERLDLRDGAGVKKQGGRITEIVMESGRAFRGRTFIDATYEGDLMAKAGVGYHVGREANDVYGETLNGWQPALNVKLHRFVVNVDPYVKPGDPSSGLLPNAGVRPGPPPTPGSGDQGVQAYCFRLCTTDHPATHRPWPKPANYDERNYELLLRNFEAGDHRAPWNPIWMPNRKTDTNNNCAVSTDYIGYNHDYPEADYATRQRITDAHRDYQMGLMWTLANHPRVPAKVRAEFTRLGLAKDEFTDNDNWPTQLYVREARRMISDYVMTEANCRGARLAEDSVGMGAYGMDSHNVWRFVTPEGFIQNEGDIQVHGFVPYPISYRSIVPKKAECENLLVPVCLSASHIAYGSIRMEPVFMVLGQSAATAAAQAIDAGVAVQDVDYARLRERLLADRQALAWTGPKPAASQGRDPAKLAGVVVDDAKARRTGEWVASSSTAGFVGAGYLHDNDEGKGAKSARFTLQAPAAGEYEVRISYPAYTNRATNVPVSIKAGGETKTVKVNQRRPAPIDGAFAPLGTFRLDKGQEVVVEVSNEGTDGHVIVDAVQLVPAGER